MAQIHPGQTSVSGIGSVVAGAKTPEKLAAEKLVLDELARQEETRKAQAAALKKRQEEQLLNQKREDELVAQAAARQRLEIDRKNPSFLQNVVNDLTKTAVVATVVGEIAHEKLDQHTLESDYTKTQQEQLANIMSASTPESTRVAGITSATGPNTPEFHRVDNEQREKANINDALEQVALFEASKLGRILHNREVEDQEVRAQISNDATQAAQAFRAIQNGKQTSTPEQINTTNDVLIDFHRAVESIVLKAEQEKQRLAAEQKAQQITPQVEKDPVAHARLVEQERQAQEAARTKAKEVADEATARLVRDNRAQSVYLAELDRLHQQQEDRRLEMLTKQEAINQAAQQNAMDPQQRDAVNLDPAIRTKLEAQGRTDLNSGGGAKPPTFDKEGNYVDPHRKSQEDQEIDSRPNKFVQDYHEVYAMEGGVPTNDHIQKDVGFSETHAQGERRDPGRNVSGGGPKEKSPAPIAPRSSVTVDHGGDIGIEGVGHDPLVRELNRNNNPNI